MMWIVRLAWREIRGRSQWLLAFVLCIGAGVVARMTVAGFMAQTRQAMTEDPGAVNALLGADFELRSSAPFSSGEEEILERVLPGAMTRRVVELLTMATGVGTERSRLVRLRAVDGMLPFYGQRETNPYVPSDALQKKPQILIEPGLIGQLRVDVGGRVKLGTQVFEVTGILLNEPGAGLAPISPGPLVLIGLDQLARTGLTAWGSRVQYLIQLKAPPGRDLGEVERELKRAFEGTRVEMMTAQQAQLQTRALMSRITDVLIFLAFLALLLGGTGVACAVRAFVMERVDAIAVLRCLGASTREVTGVFFLQAVFMGAIGSVVGAVAGLFGQGILAQSMGQQTLQELMSWGNQSKSVALGGIDPAIVFGGVAMGLVITVAASLMPLLSIRRIHPLRLIRRDASASPPVRFDGLQVTVGVAVLGLVWSAAALEISSWRLAAALTAGSLAAGVVLWGAALGLIRVGRRWKIKPRAGWWIWRHGWKNAVRGGSGTSLGLAALGLGVAFLGTLSMVQSSLLHEMEEMKTRNITGLFVIDIQSDQREPVERWLAANGVTSPVLAPLVRGRLAAINGIPNKETGATGGSPRGTPEGSGESWARHREWNMSWRETLGQDERVTAGRFMSPDSKNEASVEQSFAKRLGVGVGDRLDVDIQGVRVTAAITSLRTVRWTSFRPNFFVLLSRSTLEGAPQTWVASLPRMDRQAQGAFQTRLIEQFPNLTAIDVSDAMERIAELLGRILAALRLVSVFAVVAGLAVVTAIVVSSVRERLYEVVLWRLLGASAGEVLGMLCVEFVVWGTLASLLGWALASGASAYVVGAWFDLPWWVAWKEVGLITGGVIGLTVVTGWLVSSELLIHPPLAVLRQE